MSCEIVSTGLPLQMGTMEKAEGTPALLELMNEERGGVGVGGLSQ